MRLVDGDLELRPWEAGTVEPFSTASICVLERIGMPREGLMRSNVIYGDRVGDAYLYAAVRGDF